jgi:Ca2+-binding RTX toxin-like protein
VATIVGTPGPDVLVGHSEHAVITGLGGADDISGAFKFACGGRGADRIKGGWFGGAVEFGGPGDDVLDHEDFVDFVDMFGGPGDDHMDGYSSHLEGGPGDDVMNPGLGFVSYRHAAGRIVAYLGRGLVLGEGRDRVSSAYGLIATRFADRIFGAAHSVGVVAGLGGDDVMSGTLETYGGGGDDTIRGGPGDQVINGGAGDDTLYGGLGDDRLYGYTGDADSAFGGQGDDVCRAERVEQCERD